MAYLALSPAKEAIYGLLLLDDTLTALLPGGVQTDVPAETPYPFLWIEVIEDPPIGGFGTQPGSGAMPALDLRIHIFQGDYGTMADAERIMARAIALIIAAPPSLAGYNSLAIFYTGAIPLPDEELNGVKVKELVAGFRWLVEETP